VTELETEILRIERTFAAPPEEVFDAWTNPEVLRRWWAVQPSWRTPVADVDLRVDGGYRLSMEDPDSGEIHTVFGEYREVRRPERLVYTWTWEGTGPMAGHESLVTVEFRGVGEGGGTLVVLEHAGLLDAASRDRHRGGWTGTLENLAGRVFPPDAVAGSINDQKEQ
jgi:uncharacterized protein YndB with AHSA1/START domain